MVAPKAPEEQLGYFHRLHTVSAQSKHQLGSLYMQAAAGLMECTYQFRRRQEALVDLYLPLDQV